MKRVALQTRFFLSLDEVFWRESFRLRETDKDSVALACQDNHLHLEAFGCVHRNNADKCLLGRNKREMLLLVLFPVEVINAFDQLILVDRHNWSHLVTQKTKIIDVDDRLTLVSAVSLRAKCIEKISRLINFQLSHFLACKEESRKNLLCKALEVADRVI